MILALLTLAAAQGPAQGPASPLAENAAAIAALLKVPAYEVRHVDGETVLGTRSFRRDDEAGQALLGALARDFAKRPNDDEYKCGFHADAAIVPLDPKAPKFQLCFGCGEVRVELPPTKAVPMRRRLQWTMNDRAAVKAAVQKLYPAARLGRGGSL